VVETTRWTPGDGGRRDASHRRRDLAFEYSEDYKKQRGKITTYAAERRIPLSPPSSKLASRFSPPRRDRKTSAHIAIRVGNNRPSTQCKPHRVLNMSKRKGSNGHKRRMIHGILMLASGAGFANHPDGSRRHRDRTSRWHQRARTRIAASPHIDRIGTPDTDGCLLAAK